MMLYLSLVVFLSISFVASFNLKGETRASSRLLEMKGKGRRVPIDQRGEYVKR